MFFPLMLARKKGTWLTLLPLLVLTLPLRTNMGGYSANRALLGWWAVLSNLLIPIAIGMLMTDQLVRARRCRMDQLFNTTRQG